MIDGKSGIPLMDPLFACCLGILCFYPRAFYPEPFFAGCTIDRCAAEEENANGVRVTHRAAGWGKYPVYFSNGQQFEKRELVN